MRERLTEKIAKRVREELLRGGQVHLEGFGIFKRVHHAAEEETQPDGTIIMHPPRYEVQFEPEKEGA